MKHLILVILGTLGVTFSLMAQKLSADKVPAAVMTAYSAKFPTAKGTEWELEAQGKYEAMFKLNDLNMSAIFYENGTWKETETEMKVADLPSAVTATLKRDYSTYSVTEASRIEMANGTKVYEAEIKKGGEKYDALFTPDGKFVSKTKADADEPGKG